MKKAFVILAALALTSVGSTFAQTAVAPARPAKSPEQRADRLGQYFAKQLSLSPDQEARFEPILQAQLQEMQGLKEKYPAGNRRGAGPELKAAKAKYDEQFKAVLTPEQFTKFEQIRQEQVQKMRDRRQG
jgi:Spy/CpxP family protein refolding chaperone